MLALILWICCTFGSAIVLTLVLIRKQVKTFPRFTTYLAATIILSLGTMLARLVWGYKGYFYGYHVSSAILAVALLFTADELLSSMFIRHNRFRQQFCCSLVLIGVVCSALAITTKGQHVFLTGFAVFEEAITWIVCLSFVVVIGTSRHLGLCWRKRNFGILLGMLVSLIPDTLLNAALVHWHPAILSVASTATFLCAEAIWVTWFLKADSPVLKIPREAYTDMVLTSYVEILEAVMLRAGDTTSCALTDESRWQQTLGQTKGERGALVR